MDWEIELVPIPVSDVDRAKSFYVDQVGFNADHDHQVSERLRFVQLTPPGPRTAGPVPRALMLKPPRPPKFEAVLAMPPPASPTRRSTRANAPGPSG